MWAHEVEKDPQLQQVINQSSASQQPQPATTGALDPAASQSYGPISGKDTTNGVQSHPYSKPADSAAATPAAAAQPMAVAVQQPMAAGAPAAQLQQPMTVAYGTDQQAIAAVGAAPGMAMPCGVPTQVVAVPQMTADAAAAQQQQYLLALQQQQALYLQYAAAAAAQQAAGASLTPAAGGGSGQPSTGWITNRLIDREKARIEKNYAEADRLRSQLRENGVEVDDRLRTWSCKDGRKGHRPNHNDPHETE